MKVVTFYSYKGGCGRSLSLINTALALNASQGSRIGLLDLDLEAAALHCLANVQPQGSNLLNLLQPGKRGLAEIEKYIVPVPIAKNIESGIFLVPTITDAALLSKIPWNKGVEFFLKDEFIPAFENIYKLDYLFIDSRSGLSDTANFSLRISDLTVIVCRIDKQNRDGIKRMATVFRSLMKPLMIVVSGCPNPLKYKNKIEEFSTHIGLDIDFITPYMPELYFEESLVVLDHKKSPLAKDYLEMANSIHQRGLDNA